MQSNNGRAMTDISVIANKCLKVVILAICNKCVSVKGI